MIFIERMSSWSQVVDVYPHGNRSPGGQETGFFVQKDTPAREKHLQAILLGLWSTKNPVSGLPPEQRILLMIVTERAKVPQVYQRGRENTKGLAFFCEIWYNDSLRQKCASLLVVL
jgi:hypothetical protein